MNPTQALEWLHQARFSGIKLGLENTVRLLEELGNPHVGRAFIHVAGTNGKGSVCAMLDRILREAGFRTGLYTSPHLVDFRERIRVDGFMIPPATLAGGLSRIRDLSEKENLAPTFFEITTALALTHFAETACDVSILETGMGGRLDSTNAVTPRVSVVTPIDMDHQAWLGDTIAAIAGEKAGIIKPGIPVVSAPQHPEAQDVLQSVADRAGSALQFVKSPWSGTLPLAGSHQHWNAALAVAALNAAGLRVSAESIRHGLAATTWPARFQLLPEETLVDGAHNLHSVRALVQTWRAEYGSSKATIIFGALADKDPAAMLRELEAIAERFLFVPVRSERTADPSTFHALVRVPSKVLSGLEDALHDPDRPRIVCGSLFLAGEALQALNASPS